MQARCALTAKGISYWSIIPQLFKLSAEQDHSPCPFADGRYQLMRNCALACELARWEQRRPGFALLFSDGDPAVFHSAGFVADDSPSGWVGFTDLLQPGRIHTQALSYQSLLEALAAGSCAETKETIDQLTQWVLEKILLVEQRKRAAMQKAG